MNLTKERDTLLIKISESKAELNNSHCTKASPKSNSKFVMNSKRMNAEEKRFLSKTTDIRNSVIKK